MSSFEHLLNRYEGRTCVVIGNGPSLQNVSNGFFSRYHTFGTNRIYLRWIPTWYSAVNLLVLDQFRREIERLDTVMFLPDHFFEKSKQGAKMFSLHQEPGLRFSVLPHKHIWDGGTVTFVALQIVFFLGYSKVLLVGVDHRYTFVGKPHEEVLMAGDDPNHFDLRYFKGHRWNNPDLETSEAAYTLARSAFEAEGRQIVNLTEGTALKVFEKGNINDY